LAVHDRGPESVAGARKKCFGGQIAERHWHKGVASSRIAFGNWRRDDFNAAVTRGSLRNSGNQRAKTRSSNTRQAARKPAAAQSGKLPAKLAKR